MSRRCGECRLCCLVLNVAPLNKPAGTPCQHLCRQGCGIYAERPNACREFECAYLIGALPAKLRPRRTNAVVWVTVLLSPSSDTEIPVLAMTARSEIKVDARLREWCVERSGIMPVVIEHGRYNELYTDGKKQARWHEDDFINVDIQNGRIVSAEVKSWPEVFGSEAERDAYRESLKERITVRETNQKYAEAML